MQEPIPGKGIQPKVGPDGNVLGSSLNPEELKIAATALITGLAGFEGTSIDPETGAILINTLTEEEWKSLSPLQQVAYLNGVQKKQDVALDAIRAKEAEQGKK